MQEGLCRQRIVLVPRAPGMDTGRGGGWRLFKQLQLNLLLEYAEETIRCGE